MVRGSAPVIDLSSHPVLTTVNTSELPLFPSSRNFTHTYIDTQSLTTYVCNHLLKLACIETQSHMHMVTHTQSHSQTHMCTHTHTHTHTSLAQCTFWLEHPSSSTSEQEKTYLLGSFHMTIATFMFKTPVPRVLNLFCTSNIWHHPILFC